MSAPAVFVVRDRHLLAQALAARMVTTLVERQAAAPRARILLAGDPFVDEVLAAVAASAARDAVDWSQLEVWWADDAWAAADDPMRADRRAWAALFAAVSRGGDGPTLHPHPGTHEAPDVDEAAAQYATELAAARDVDDHGPTPEFDVAVLVVRPDGSVAGLFPEQPAVHDQRPVCAVRGAPQPPTTRITLTVAGLASSAEVWLVAAGPEVATAAHLMLGAAGPVQVPAAGVRGSHRTVVVLDRAAAARLPQALSRLASP